MGEKNDENPGGELVSANNLVTTSTHCIF